MTSTDNPQTLEVSDTTIAFNRASRGAGVLAERQDGNETTLQRVTIADNAATGAPGGGLTILDLEFVLIEDSIIARNTGNIGSAAVVIAPSNCSVILPSTGGGNVESGTDCGLERQNTTGGLATALADNGGQTPTLALPWTSDVHDFAGACTGTDQRDVARPQGAGCDPGAYEATPPRRPWWSRRRRRRRPPPDDGPDPHADGHSGPDARDQPDDRRRARARHGPGEGARGEGVREAGRHEGASRSARPWTRARAASTLTSIPKPGAPPETADVLRRDLQGHAVARDHQPDAGRGSSPAARRRAARARRPRRSRASCGVTARARSARPASTARRPCAARSGWCRTRAPGRSRGSRRAASPCGARAAERRGSSAPESVFSYDLAGRTGEHGCGQLASLQGGGCRCDGHGCCW